MIRHKLIIFGFAYFVLVLTLSAHSNSSQKPKYNSPGITCSNQIIADHTVVDQFDKIPPEYINEVKKMLYVIAGESHQNAYSQGLINLEDLDATYQVDLDGVDEPSPYTETRLRVDKVTWGDIDNETGWMHFYGEEDWFTSPLAISRTKAGISYMHANGYTMSAFGFAWCWDMHGDATATTDPVYGFHWYGTTMGGPEGAKPWGLDAADFAVTGNTVCMDTYLAATQEYIDYCVDNSIPTKIFFTTGPLDESGTDESRYQVHIKHEYIRNYVKADSSRILFDYADILAWDDEGTPTTDTWDGHSYPKITATNSVPEQTGHISNAGALRLAKAQWWMLARIAGWEGVTDTNAVYYVAVDGDDDNPGTIDQPWATWQKGFSTAVAGDTVYFRGGIYYPSLTTRDASIVYINPYATPSFGHDGTSDNRIYMIAYPGETPILDCKNVAVPNLYLNGIGLNRANFWTIKGLTVRNVLQSKESTCQGFVSGGCSNLTLENVNVHHIGGKGILNYNYFKHETYPEQANIDGDTTRYINCDASYCMDSIGRDVGRTDFGNYSDGFWINVQSPLSYVIIEGCRSWTNSDDGYDMPTTGVIRMNNCWAFDNGHLLLGGGQGIRNDPATNPILPWTISNCISANNLYTGFTTGYNGSASKPLNFYNNIAYHNQYGIIAFKHIEEAKIKIFKNNVFYGNTTFDALIIDTTLIHTNNFWGDNVETLNRVFTIPDHSPAVSVTDADFVSLAWTEMLRPRKADGSLPDITFLRLAHGSDLIDAGIDVGLPFTGSAPDLGAFEFSPPDTVLLQNRQFGPTRTDCFNALQTITTAGNETTFIVDDGGIVDLIAGVNIIMLPGTRVLSGGNLHARITTDRNYCTGPAPEPAAKSLTDKLPVQQLTKAIETGNDQSNMAFFNVYPNPTPGHFTLALSGYDLQEQVEVTIYGIRGERILKKTIFGEKQSDFNIEDQLPGVYLIQVLCNKKVGVKRIIKQ